MKKFIHSLILTLSFNTAAGLAANANEPPIAERPHRYAAIVTDASGNVLYSRDPQQSLHPASTTKVMTAYLVFEAIQNGTLTMDQKLPVSYYAASRERTNLGMTSSKKSVTAVVRKGKKVQKVSWSSQQVIHSITVKNALLGLITHSANDAAVVLAEKIGGSEAGFARMMNAKAVELGMTHTTFKNPNGLPHAQQRTTVEDMAKLSRAIVADFPEDYKLFNTTQFTYNGVTYKSFNELLKNYPGADGIKTGTIRASGSNLTASAVRDDKRIFAVIFGASSAKQRNSDMTYLLDYGFYKLKDPTVTFTEPPKVSVKPGDDDNSEEKEGFGTQTPVPPSEEIIVPSTDSGITIRIKITPAPTTRSTPQVKP